MPTVRFLSKDSGLNSLLIVTAFERPFQSACFLCKHRPPESIFMQQIRMSRRGTFPCPFNIQNLSTAPISDHFDGFISSQVAAGRYETASEVVRAGLQMLEDYEIGYQRQLDALRAHLDEGIDQLDRGEGVRMSVKEAVAEHKKGKHT